MFVRYPSQNTKTSEIYPMKKTYIIQYEQQTVKLKAVSGGIKHALACLKARWRIYYICTYIYIYISHTYLYLNFGAGPRGIRSIRGSELRFGLENTVGSFEIAIPARSAPAVPSEGP